MSITTNKSFIDLYFRLTETDGLQRRGLDFLVEGPEHRLNPFDTYISRENIISVCEKVHEDFWYFIKELVSVPVQGGTARFKINKTNLASLIAMHDGYSVFSSQPRQTYGTITRAVFVLWKLITTDEEIYVMSPDLQSSGFFVDKVISINKLLPGYIQMNKHEIKKRLIKISDRSSWAFINEFEGLIVINDMEFIDNINAFIGRISEQVESGKHIQISANSTVGDYDTSGRRAADKIIEKGNIWKNEYFRSKLSRSDLRKDIVFVYYSYKELVDDPDNWFELMCKCLNNDPLHISREVLLER